MSSNNVVNNTDSLLEHNTHLTLRKMGHKYVMATDYLVGEKPDLNKFKKIKRLTEILKQRECQFDSCFDNIKETLHTLTIK
jgi:hypothetical protein